MTRRLIAVSVTVLFLQACGGGGGSQPTPPPPVNTAPQASDQTTAVNPNTAVSGTLGATDANGDTLTFAIVTDPVSGAVTLSGTGSQSFEYSPNAAFVGADSFTFEASDGTATSNTATVTVNVNSAPVASGVSLSTSEATSIDGTVTATDSESDNVTFVVSTQPSKGTVSAFDAATGAFTYTPDPAQDGLDSFAVTASDAFQTSADAQVNIEIFKWAGTQQFGTTLLDNATTGGLYIAPDGGFVFGGSTNGQIASAAPLGDQDGWLRKVDRRGNEIWTVQLGDANRNNSRIIAPDPDGSGTFVLTESGPSGETILKFDNDGNEQLNAAVDFGGANVVAAGYWGTIDGNGDAYVLSWTSPDPTSISSLITKVDGSNGGFLWRHAMNTSIDDPITPFIPSTVSIQVRSIDFSASGDSIVSGWFRSDGSTTRPCAACAFVASFDPDGNLLWLNEINDFSGACQRSTEGRLYRVGVAPDQTLWAVGNVQIDSTGEAFGQVSHYSSDGTQLLWTHCESSGNGDSFNFTPIYFAQNGDGLMYGHAHADGVPISSQDGPSSLILLRLDVDGSIVFRRKIGALKTDGSDARMQGASLVEDSQGLFYLSGATNGDLTPSAAAGELDVFLMRLGADGNPQ